MNATEMSKERISAWLDGELDDTDVDTVLAALTSAEGRAVWHEYHQVGDTLRSDELGVTLSAGFAEKMAQRLAAEPYLLVPALENAGAAQHVRQNPQSSQSNSVRNLPESPKRNYRHRMWAGVAIAAGLLVVVGMPYMPLGGQETPGMASAPQAANVARVIASPVAPAQLVSSQEGAGVLLRDPQIEQYLIAHQRFSPSVYSAAQYARPTTLKKNGTGK